MPEPASSIADLFKIPTRFLRSVQLERDFSDPTALDNYVVTPHVTEAFTRIVDGLRIASGRRAWRLTGNYGVGKSSFALALSHILEGGGSVPGLKIKRSTKTPSLWPILLTGSREPLLPAIARGIAESLRQRYFMDRRRRTLMVLAQQADAARASADTAGVLRLIDDVRDHAAADGAGVLLIVDELGKFLTAPDCYPKARELAGVDLGSTRASAIGADGAHIVVDDASGDHHLWLRDVRADQKLAALLPLDDDFRVRVLSLIRFQRRLTGRSSGPPPKAWQITRRHRQRLTLMVRALDAHLADASYREIADALYGAEAVTRYAWKTSSIRRQTIRLVKDAIGMMRGGYRKLLRGD